MQFNPYARQDAAERYSDIANDWIERFGIAEVSARKSLSGRAWPRDRKISVPWPATTRRRLYIVAHEIGHVALNHLGSRPSYVQEFEAERFAHELMRQSGLPVPRVMTRRAKGYVRRKIDRAFRSGAQWIDPSIAAWAETDVSGINDAPGTKKRSRHFHDKSLARVRAALTPAAE